MSYSDSCTEPNFLVALFCNLSRFAGLNKTWEVLSTKVDRGPLTIRRQGPSEISKLWGSFKARTVLIPFWIPSPGVPTKVDLHVHHVTCVSIKSVLISRAETAIVSVITENRRIYGVRSLFGSDLPQSGACSAPNTSAVEIQFPN